MQQAEGAEPFIEPGEQMVWSAFDAPLGQHSLIGRATVDEPEGMEPKSDSNWAAWLACRKSMVCSMHIKILN
ncbi:hypothetical protein WL1483_4231 [Aeromonas schubertii]|uniref:Uncharacterized protein n=1 Tax=Aeromonas schubertii TaxID=652 RepID=A0A0S2SPR1_9GAMM|nr:hypothetical protein WL1483_4231 [Aeromonas schubertii]